MRYCLLLVTIYLTSQVASTSYKRVTGEMRLRSARGFRDKLASLQTARNFGKRSSTNGGGEFLDAEGDGGAGSNLGPGPESTESLYNVLRENFSSDNLERQLPVAWIAQQLSTSPYLIKVFLTEFVDSNKDGLLSAEELTSTL